MLRVATLGPDAVWQMHILSRSLHRASWLHLWGPVSTGQAGATSPVLTTQPLGLSRTRHFQAAPNGSVTSLVGSGAFRATEDPVEPQGSQTVASTTFMPALRRPGVL